MKKLNEFGYTKAELLIVVILLGIVSFITINWTSYAFKIDKTSGMEEIKSLAVIQAKEYGVKHPEIFKETNTTYISVNDLVEDGLLMGNDDGLITDPVDTSKNYNDSKIKLEYDQEQNQVDATFVD